MKRDSTYRWCHIIVWLHVSIAHHSRIKWLRRWSILRLHLVLIIVWHDAIVLLNSHCAEILGGDPGRLILLLWKVGSVLRSNVEAFRVITTLFSNFTPLAFILCRNRAGTWHLVTLVGFYFMISNPKRSSQWKSFGNLPGVASPDLSSLPKILSRAAR